MNKPPVSVDWSAYDRFDWAAAAQAPMSGDERQIVANLAAAVLGVEAVAGQGYWGLASSTLGPRMTS